MYAAGQHGQREMRKLGMHCRLGLNSGPLLHVVLILVLFAANADCWVERAQRTRNEALRKHIGERARVDGATCADRVLCLVDNVEVSASMNVSHNDGCATGENRGRLGQFDERDTRHGCV
jgi:hypothetical protein